MCVCVCVCVCVLVTQPCLTLLQSHKPPGSSVHVNSLGKNTEVGSHSFFQGILLTQGSNLSLLHCSQILFHLSHQGNPWSTNSSPVYICRKQNSNSKAYIYCNVDSSNIYHRQDMEATQVPLFFFSFLHSKTLLFGLFQSSHTQLQDSFFLCFPYPFNGIPLKSFSVAILISSFSCYLGFSLGHGISSAYTFLFILIE